MTVTLTVLMVSIVFAVYLAARMVARSWVSTGSSIDRILAEVTATPARPVVSAPVRATR